MVYLQSKDGTNVKANRIRLDKFHKHLVLHKCQEENLSSLLGILRRYLYYNKINREVTIRYGRDWAMLTLFQFPLTAVTATSTSANLHAGRQTILPKLEHHRQVGGLESVEIVNQTLRMEYTHMCDVSYKPNSNEKSLASSWKSRYMCQHLPDYLVFPTHSLC